MESTPKALKVVSAGCPANSAGSAIGHQGAPLMLEASVVGRWTSQGPQASDDDDRRERRGQGRRGGPERADSVALTSARARESTNGNTGGHGTSDAWRRT